jgi:hypothetical protein
VKIANHFAGVWSKMYKWCTASARDHKENKIKAGCHQETADGISVPKWYLVRVFIWKVTPSFTHGTQNPLSFRQNLKTATGNK